MRTFRISAVVSVISTYFLILVGGFVRVAGAGMGCPDWPKCFDSWIPPTSKAGLPDHIDPETFNVMLAWIEYMNRVVGVTIGIVIIITMYFALKYCRKHPKILYSTVASLVLVIFIGWQGSQVVATDLNPLIVSFHMLMALVLVSTLIYAAQQSYYVEFPGSEEDSVYDSDVKKGFTFLFGFTLIQVVVGTQIREAVEHLIKVNPEVDPGELLVQVGGQQNFHWLLGVAMFVMMIHYSAKVFKFSKNPSNFVKKCTMGMLILMVLQLAIGLTLTLAGLPRFLQLMHLWAAAIYLGLNFMVLNAVKNNEKMMGI